MDSATGWILGICAAVIGSVIALFLEYGYFKKRKQSEEAQEAVTTEHLLWKDAIDRAVQDFGKNHSDSIIEVKGWSVRKDKAQVDIHTFYKPLELVEHKDDEFVEIQPPQSPTWYVLIVDRVGDILEIRRR